jgi:hypothetical protein
VLLSGFVECKVGSEVGPDNGPPEHSHWVSAHQLPHKGHAAVLQNTDNVRPHQVQVFLAEFLHLILDLAGVVLHDERSLSPLRHLVELVVLVHSVEFLQQSFMRGAGKTNMETVIRKHCSNHCRSIHLLALVIQDAEQPAGLSLDHGQAASIVLKVNALPLDPLFAVLLLLVLEHMLIEVKLQMLVGIVDAELLVAVEEI